MRVAVCISGQMRSLERAYPSILSNIIQPNAADVFLHSWYDDAHLVMESMCPRPNLTLPPDLPRKAVELYQPKRHAFERPRRFDNKAHLRVPPSWCTDYAPHLPPEYTDADRARHIVRQAYSMFYSIHACNQLREDYAEEHGITYDVVVRLRFDLTFHAPVRFADYDLTYLWCHELNQPDGIVSDWFQFGSPRVMNVAASTYLALEALNSFDYLKAADRQPLTWRASPHCFWGNEHMIRDVIAAYHIPFRKANFGVALLSH